MKAETAQSRHYCMHRRANERKIQQEQFLDKGQAWVANALTKDPVAGLRQCRLLFYPDAHPGCGPVQGGLFSDDSTLQRSIRWLFRPNVLQP